MTKVANILFIENNADVKLQVMAKISGRYYCDIMTANDLQEALVCVKKRWYDFILINVIDCADIGNELNRLMNVKQVETIPLLGVKSPIIKEDTASVSFMDKIKSAIGGSGNKSNKVIIDESIYKHIYSTPFNDDIFTDDFIGKYLKKCASEKDKNNASIKVSWDVMEALKLLGLNPYSSEKEIKLRYRQLVKENHPDQNKNNNMKTFQKITEAYDVVCKSEIGK